MWKCVESPSVWKFVWVIVREKLKVLKHLGKIQPWLRFKLEFISERLLFYNNKSLEMGSELVLEMINATTAECDKLCWCLGSCFSLCKQKWNWHSIRLKKHRSSTAYLYLLDFKRAFTGDGPVIASLSKATHYTRYPHRGLIKRPWPKKQKKKRLVIGLQCHSWIVEIFGNGA